MNGLERPCGEVGVERLVWRGRWCTAEGTSMLEPDREGVKMYRKAGNCVRKCVGVKGGQNQLIYVGSLHNLSELAGGTILHGGGS